MRSFIRRVAVALLALVALPALAITFSASLRGSAENPPNASTATGTGVVDIAGSTMTVTMTYSGLSAGATAGHIHCCAQPTANAGIAVDFNSQGFVTGATSGTYTRTFDLTATATYNATFLTNNGGTAAGARAALEAGMRAGTAYLNVHNSAFPAGEIRGNLLSQFEAVPLGGKEWIAIMLALAGVYFGRRHFQNRA
jgi:hypothetical protein